MQDSQCLAFFIDISFFDRAAKERHRPPRSQPLILKLAKHEDALSAKRQRVHAQTLLGNKGQGQYTHVGSVIGMQMLQKANRLSQMSEDVACTTREKTWPIITGQSK